MARLSDDALWRAVQDQAARTGWHDRALLIDTATEALCKRHRLTTDAEREDVSGRLSRLWAARMGIMEPN